jgi:hypothetical protein
MSDCTDCKHDCGFSGIDWYSQGAVSSHYCRTQVAWLIRYAWQDTEGKYHVFDWPGRKTGYSGIPENVQKSDHPVSKNAGTIEIWSEIAYRLDRTGEDGLTLISELQAGLSLVSLSRAARKALNYTSGWKRRMMSYNNWRKQQRYRGNKCTAN